MAAHVLIWLDSIAAYAQSRDDNASGSIDISNSGGIANQSSAPAAVSQDRNGIPIRFSARAGFASDYVSRGTTESAHQPAMGAVFEAALGPAYVGSATTSVKLPNKAEAEVTMSSGIRPKIANVDLDFGWTYYFYPAGGSPPAGTLANIDYVEFVARGSTDFGELVHFAAGSGYSPSYSNTGAWSDYSAFGVALDMPRKFLPPDLTATFSGGAGYFWFGNQSASLGGFPLPDYLNWNLGLTLVRKEIHLDLRYYDTNLSKEQCFVLTGDLTGGFGGQVNPVSNPLGRVSTWCSATFVAKVWYAFN
jgi:uncharacterized protein (TIGR02001 family)